MTCCILGLYESVISVVFINRSTELSSDDICRGLTMRLGCTHFQDIRARWEEVPGALGETSH